MNLVAVFLVSIGIDKFKQEGIMKDKKQGGKEKALSGNVSEFSTFELV